MKIMLRMLSALGGVQLLVALWGGFQASQGQKRDGPVPLKRRMLQFVVLGNSGVGKTRMLQQFVYGNSSLWTSPTIGADFYLKNVLLDDTSVTLQIWDIGGQDGIALGPGFFQCASGCLLVHNSNSTSSIENLQSWLRAFEALSGAKLKEGFPAAVLITDFVGGTNTFCQGEIGAMNALCWKDSEKVLPVYQMMSPTDNQAAVDAFMYIIQAALQNKCSQISYYDENGVLPFQTDDEVWACLGG